MFARLLAEAVPRTEDASRTTGVCFAHRVSLPYRKSLFLVRRASENASRTPGGLFEHRMLIPYRRSLFLVLRASENASRTTGGCFEHRMLIPYRRSLFLVRRASENASHLVVRSTGKLLPLRNFELNKRKRPTLWSTST